MDLAKRTSSTRESTTCIKSKDKNTLMIEIEKAQNLLNSLNETRKILHNLFTDDYHTTLKETTTQANVDTAKENVDQLPSNNDKNLY